MTRSWQFTLSSSTIWYNLWTLITSDLSFTDPTFTTAPYVPSSVCELNISSTGIGTNTDIYVSEDSNDEVGVGIAAGAVYKKSTNDNYINLKTFSVKGDVVNGIINVNITSK